MYPNCFMWPYKYIMNAFYATLTFHFKLHMHINSKASADKNELNCEKVRFLQEVSEINSR